MFKDIKMCSEYQAVLSVVPQKDNLVMDCTVLSKTPAIPGSTQIHSRQRSVINWPLYVWLKYQSWQKCEGNVATKQGDFETKGAPAALYSAVWRES